MGNGKTKQWRGSVCAGVLTSRWPFGSMTVESDHIKLRSLRGTFVLGREEVQAIERGRFFPWLWMGVRFRHAHKGYPERLMFSPILFWRTGAILGHLKSLGYMVH